jgi:SAM-dependent methyltransferase
LAELTDPPVAAAQAQARDPFDARVCGVLGFSLAPPDRGVPDQIVPLSSGEILLDLARPAPTFAEPEPPEGPAEPLEVALAPAEGSSQATELLEVALAPGAGRAPEPESSPASEAPAAPPVEPTAPSLFMPLSLLRPAPAEEVQEPEQEPEPELEPEPEPAREPEGAPEVDSEREPESGPGEATEAEELEPELDEEPPPAAEPAAGEPAMRPPGPPPARRRAWYDDVFTEHFALLEPAGAQASAERDVEFLLAAAEPPAGAAILDVACGVGRHAIELAHRGYHVTGVDSSLAQLLRASELNEQRGTNVAFLHGDMRGLPVDDAYDLVLLLGTSLGYFEEETNQQVLEEVRDRLSPTGRLVLQVFNRDYLVGKLPLRSWWQGDKCMVLDEAELNFVANRLRVHRTVVFEDGRQFEHYMFLRAYSVHELGRLLRLAGLKVEQLSGSRDTRGRFYGSASPDIWIVASRRGDA